MTPANDARTGTGTHRSLIEIPCPYCSGTSHSFWAEERGYTVVRCDGCRFLYLNPAPPPESVSEAVMTGFHHDEAGDLDVRAHRSEKKVDHYEAIIKTMFADKWSSEQPIHWLDIGSGYGEIIEAVSRLAPKGSTIEGIEPMKPKADAARERGLTVTNDYLRRDHPKVDIASSIDVFSHIPDYRAFLADVVAVLKPGGEFLIETGNLADVDERSQFPFELGVPDHLTFAGRAHLEGLLDEAGFEVVTVQERRVDDLMGAAKNLVKILIGRPGGLSVPYQSKYRQLVIRARLRE